LLNLTAFRLPSFLEGIIAQIDLDFLLFGILQDDLGAFLQTSFCIAMLEPQYLSPRSLFKATSSLMSG